MAQRRIRTRFVAEPADVIRAQRLRQAAFAPEKPGGRDADGHDSACRHILVEDAAGELLCTFRLLLLGSGAQIGRSYAARYYDLAKLERFQGRMLEVGRFCVLPGTSHPDILRVAWGAVARIVEEEDVRLLFGCSSFRGTESGRHGDAFALLAERHVAPRSWRPGVKAPEVFRFGNSHRHPDLARATRTMPPLLRFYLALGGWVSDHAVIDRDLGTLHVFTGVQTALIPTARVRFLRAGVA